MRIIRGLAVFVFGRAAVTKLTQPTKVPEIVARLSESSAFRGKKASRLGESGYDAFCRSRQESLRKQFRPFDNRLAMVYV